MTTKFIPPHVIQYVDSYIDWLFESQTHTFPNHRPVVLEDSYTTLPINVQIQLHLDGVLIIPFFGEVFFPISEKKTDK